MQMSEQLRKYFVKDMSIPIQVLQDPYFYNYIQLLDPYFDTFQKMKLLEDAIEFYDSEEDFMVASARIRNYILNTIKALDAYKRFNTMDMSSFRPISLVSNQNLYNPLNDGKLFVSIDLVKANFQSLEYAVNGIWNELSEGIHSYTDLVTYFSSTDYFRKSKKIRQIIFGNLNPKRQQTIQRHIMSLLKADLIKDDVIKENDIKMASSDELVWVEENERLGYSDIAPALEERAIEVANAKVRVTIFRLKRVGTDNFKFYVKEEINDNGEKKIIKGVNSAYMPEVVRFLNGESSLEVDRFYMNDGRLSKFVNPLF